MNEFRVGLWNLVWNSFEKQRKNGFAFLFGFWYIAHVKWCAFLWDNDEAQTINPKYKLNAEGNNNWGEWECGYYDECEWE